MAQISSSHVAKELASRERMLERELEEADESGDPLTVWTNHLGWLEEQRLSGHACHLDALKRCITYFSQVPQFNSDLRLALIYIKFAEVCGDPLVMFQHMLSTGVGTTHAAVYEAYAQALERRGQRERAMAILQTGIDRKAFQHKRLLKKLEAMKQVAAQLLALPQSKASGIPYALMNEASERVEGFYSQPGLVFHYPKLQVYPEEGGGGAQLEQLRGALPRYRYETDGAGDDMDMTVAQPGHITLHVPVMDSVCGRGRSWGKENAALSLPNGDENGERVLPKESENSGAVKSGVGRPPRRPLQMLGRVKSAQEELEELCEEGKVAYPQRRGGRGSTVKRDGDSMEDVGRQLEQLAMSRPVDGAGPGVGLEDLVDQENQPVLGGGEEEEEEDVPFKFTPSTMQGGLNWPARGTGSRGMATKLSFSEADSINNSRACSLAEERGGGGGVRSGVTEFFSTTLDNERKAQLTKEQMMFENKFANSSEQVEPSFSEASWRASSINNSQSFAINNSQSFDVFHDSWASRSGANVSRPGNHSRSFKPCTAKPPPSGRVPLQMLAAEAPLEPSFQPSLSNCLSFSAFHDSQDGSSLAPFHDSWVGRRAERHAPLASSAPSMEDSSLSSSALPEMPNMSPSEQSFTQFGIPHPANDFGPSSTPRHFRSADLTFDLSVIPGEVTHIEERGNPAGPGAGGGVRPAELEQPSAAAPKVGELSTIMEESGSYRSSRSSGSSRSSASSSAGTTADSLGQSRDTLLSEINPFLPEYVNLMLNTYTAGYPGERVQQVGVALPRLVSGGRAVLGRDSYTGLKRLGEGGFARIFSAQLGSETKALKVQSPPCDWEVRVVEELHSRLKANGASLLPGCFMEIDVAYRFTNATVIVTAYHSRGTLLDLVNANLASRTSLDEFALLYFVRELLCIVSALHACGILHTDIKPDNLMLRDVRQCSSLAEIRGRGLCLIDFNRAVDVRVFPEETQFSGSSQTDEFACPQMVEGKPWKWQADYYGMAATIYSLMLGRYLEVQCDPTTGVYKPIRNLPRTFNTSFWRKYMDVLLNAPESLPLADFFQPLDASLAASDETATVTTIKLTFSRLDSYLQR